MIDDTRGWISLFLGILTTAFGVIPLLYTFGVIGFNLPFTIIGLILAILLVIGGVFLFLDAMHEDHLRWLSIIVGIIVFTLGGLTILFNLGILPDFTSTILAVEIVKNIILVVSGILLMLGSGD